MDVAQENLSDKVIADLLAAPGADETILTRWSRHTLTQSPSSTLGRDLAGDLPVPEVNTRAVFRMGENRTADYLVVGTLGEGGMGIVFEAEQVYFGRRVALKMIKSGLASDPAAVKAFFREAVITSKLDHPGIIPVLDFGVSQDDRALYAMMKAGGVPWHRVMRAKTLSENLAIFDRVADIAGYAHTRGILHRDIKPANVLLGNHGEIWLGDWGVALTRLPDGTYSHATPAGTPQYMAPEMARCDNARIGPASDIYLLGAVLFEIVTGGPPHDGENSGAALLNSAKNSIRPTSQTNGLLQIAYKAMAGRPDQRYASADDLRNAVTARLRFNESVYRQQQADTHLSNARETGDYDLFQQAIAGYDEAIALSPENSAAKQSRTQALVEYAGKALAKSELELAASIVQAETGVDKRLVRMMQKIAVEKAATAHRRRRRIGINLLLLGVVIAMLASGIYIYFGGGGGAGHVANSNSLEASTIPEPSTAPKLPPASAHVTVSEPPALSESRVVPEPSDMPEIGTASALPVVSETPDTSEVTTNSTPQAIPINFENGSAISASADAGSLLERSLKDFPQCVLDISPGVFKYDASKGKIYGDVHISIDRKAYGEFVENLSTELTRLYGEPQKSFSGIKSGLRYGKEYHSVELLKETLSFNITNRERFIFICKNVNDSRTRGEWLIYEPGEEALRQFQNAVKYKELLITLQAVDGHAITWEQIRLFYPVHLGIFHGHAPFNVTAILPLLQDMRLSPIKAGFDVVEPGAFEVTIPVEFDVSREEAKQVSAIAFEVSETKSPDGFKAN